MAVICIAKMIDWYGNYWSGSCKQVTKDSSNSNEQTSNLMNLAKGTMMLVLLLAIAWGIGVPVQHVLVVLTAEKHLTP